MHDDSWQDVLIFYVGLDFLVNGIAPIRNLKF